MAIKGYSVFPKAPALVPYSRNSLEESYPFAEMQPVYSAAPAYWAIKVLGLFAFYNGISTYVGCLISKQPKYRVER